MKKLIGTVLAASLMFSSAGVAQAAVSPTTVKTLGAQGKLPKTPGKIGMTYNTLKKSVKGGKLYDSEMGVYYATRNSTAIYLFPKFSKSSVYGSTKVYAIDRTFKQSSFTKKLTASVMQQTFKNHTYIGGQFYDSYIYRNAYKSGKYYVMHKARANNTVTLSVGKKNDLSYTGLWVND
ncbi:hypothetical protein [Kurthia massiliensis]|uniref:hypothetical protein n=1 Tax=Kurthia massiliensis TaxID=1033739 RepID=UPI0002892309|nr:hypothetical protein [Kurthia massiliensis]